MTIHNNFSCDNCRHLTQERIFTRIIAAKAHSSRETGIKTRVTILLKTKKDCHYSINRSLTIKVWGSQISIWLHHQKTCPITINNRKDTLTIITNTIDDQQTYKTISILLFHSRRVSASTTNLDSVQTARIVYSDTSSVQPKK